MVESHSRQLPPRSIGELQQPSIKREVMHHIGGASVVWANYPLILADFDERQGPCGGRELTDEETNPIDAWLLRHAAIMSAPQSVANEVNGALRIRDETVVAHRPPKYGRAAIVELPRPRDGINSEAAGEQGRFGLLDVKGCGVAPGRRPAAAMHETGLLTLQDAVAELVTCRIIDTIFSRLAIDVSCVSFYAILDLGFYGKLYDPSGCVAPAAAIVRRAHCRVPGNIDLPEKGSNRQLASVQIELMLRHFGLTSSNWNTQLRIKPGGGGGLVVSYGDRQTSDRSLAFHAKWILDELGVTAPCEFDCINVQLDRDVHVKPLRARLVDLGHYEYRTTFDLHLLSLVADRPFGWGGTLLKTSMDWLRAPGPFALDAGLLGLRQISDEIATWRGAKQENALSGLTEFSCQIAKAIVERKTSKRETAIAVDRFVDAATAPIRAVSRNDIVSLSFPPAVDAGIVEGPA
jgi:hypothetical protein